MNDRSNLNIEVYPMREILLRSIAQEFLVPFFSGAQLDENTVSSSEDDPLVQLIDENNIAFKVSANDDYKLVLHRRQPFSKEIDVVPEIRIVEAFVGAIAEMQPYLPGPLRRDLLSTFHRRVVAKSVAAIPGDENAILTGIDRLATWANKLYEGSPISSAIGFRNKPNENATFTLDQLGENDLAVTLANGHDTLLEFDFSGRFIRHVSLGADTTIDYCPLRQSPIADWTYVAERRVALTLNRLGEVLVFRGQRLLFARRSGRWSFLTHRPILTQMGINYERKLRRSIYTSCLDASFARTGACIGIVDDAHRQKLADLVNRTDLQKTSDTISSLKTKAIKQIVGGQNFRLLDRRLRQELLAIDGATLLSEEGEILAVGAILKIPAGSSGGGRLAAAKALGKLGLGIKVSQDGGIVGFRQKRNGEAFRLM